jgi:hypothetical protein
VKNGGLIVYTTGPGLPIVSNIALTVPAFPVSVKGVLVGAGRVLLLKNEWNHPGGQPPSLSNEHKEMVFFTLAEVGACGI